VVRDLRAWILVACGIVFGGFGVLAQNDRLRFVTLEFAPFIYGEEGKVTGPGRDVIAAVCAEAEIECTYDIYPWRRAQKLIRDGAADGMMVIGRNPKREKWVRFSPPMFRTEYGFFVGSGVGLSFSDLSQIAGYRIGVFAPSNTANSLKTIRDKMAAKGLEPIQIEERPDDASGLRKVSVGRLDAVYSNRDRGFSILKAEGIDGKVRYAGAHRVLKYYSGFARAFPNQALLDRFDAAWSKLFRRGEAQKIIAGYSLEPALQD